MVNNRAGEDGDLAAAYAVVRVYVTLTLATVVALAVLSAVTPRLATSEAWGHAVIVTVFAALLPLRLRAARRGSGRALRAATIIAVVLLVVNLIEAALPHAFPAWMRLDMVVVALLMATLAASLIRVARRQPVISR
jgi:hypothetical protein